MASTLNHEKYPNLVFIIRQQWYTINREKIRTELTYAVGSFFKKYREHTYPLERRNTWQNLFMQQTYI